MITIALPLYAAKNAGHIVLRGLKEMDFEGLDVELIVCEEDLAPMGKEAFEQLPVKLKYILLDQWMPLSKKWFHILDHADQKSEYFMFFSADYFPCKTILKDVRGDFYHYGRANFYDTRTKAGYEFNHNLLNIKAYGVLKAIRTEIMRKSQEFIEDYPLRGVDGWLFSLWNKVQELDIVSEDENWKQSCEVDGLNLISNTRNRFYKDGILPPFQKANFFDMDIDDINFINELAVKGYYYQIDQNVKDAILKKQEEITSYVRKKLVKKHVMPAKEIVNVYLDQETVLFRPAKIYDRRDR